MKIAITADSHLTSQAKNPERFLALKNIFKQCRENNVQLLIIAGDLFDNELPNYSEFEDLYRSIATSDLATVIIPGNHDHRLHQEALIDIGLVVYSDPTLQPLNDSRKILFLPYQHHQTMGEIIAGYSEELKDQRWILVSHGDWTGGRNTPNPYEKGLYMPLTQTDLAIYQPELVFLGHIHLAQEDKNLYYPGSPCPLDISETGLRRFLVLDTDKGEIKSHLVDSPLIYFDERFVMLPVENGLDLLLTDINDRIKSWQLPPGWENRVQIRVEISGSCSAGRANVQKAAKQAFSNFTFYRGDEPNLSNLIHSIDPDKTEISNQIKTWIDDLEWIPAENLPSKTDILEQALRIIHGGK
jgi:DNA repair exonuclease SbcCD nuclease subunit